MKYLKGKYLIACSGGPDSMALLDMCHKLNMNIRVAHINYHKRDSAIRDEKIVRKYCKENNIVFHLKNYKEEKKGNFQANARIFRYKFFKQLCDKYNLDGVLVGHHLDDHIETYLLQESHGGDFSYYGLNNKVEIYGVKVIRPLLDKTKEELLKYCLNNNINYGIDESNLKNDYERNKIRHQVIDKLTYKEKKELNKKIKLLNKEKLLIDKEVKRFINKRNTFPISELVNYKYRNNVLRSLINNSLSEKSLNDLFKQIKTNKNVRTLIDNYYVVKEYDYIEIFKKPNDYSYTFKTIKYDNYKYFKIAKKGSSFERVSITKDDLPITIRNYKESDSIQMRYGTKKINRFFIDKKVSFHERLLWPVVLNKNKEIILVPGIGCSKSHYSIKDNIFVIKLDNTED